MTKKRDVRGSDSNTDRARRALSDLETRVRAANEQFRGELQEILDLLEGETFPSAQENRAVVDTINRLLRGFGLRLKCMRRGCGHPASLTCRDSADRLYVFFYFDHMRVGERKPGSPRNRHLGRTTFPPLRIISGREAKGRRRG